ncbi:MULTISPECIES: MFS transporter [unclassified Gilliamella]|uniref:uridine transporter UriT n=1 Tax=unclassified Gilliamella TaxID=2685620 RepID=UPI00226A14DA|nr:MULTISPECIES: MFS transporter [unclassified Gilliamella]MCX8642060.1 MFS transporter [Gilliamella sp. B3835]MCX8707246.1 MFS transporter [Gilliamella sp. B3783]MCX8710845.1 MFS transporter [Gilliamella sp. B3780]MCX8714013.1 MFS transporter [Gilliamella sp. B3781]MCX8716228.1 MFS transporter [Gilliamella sp. B3784]
MIAQSNNKKSILTLMVALLAACVAFQLNASMLSPVLVTIAKELGTNDAAVGFSQTSFFTAAALFSLFLPRLSDIKGRKKVLTVMLLIMTIGTILAAVAPNIEVLYAARIIQGVSGPVVPLCLLMLSYEVKDVKQYGMLMGIITAVNGGIAGVDAIAGGLLATYWGFRSVFWVIAVVAAISTYLVYRFAPESKPSAGTKMDWLGVILIVLTLAALLLALNEAGNLANANWLIVTGLTVFAIVCFILFWNVEKRNKQPLVTTTHLKKRATWALLLTTTLTMTGIFAIVNGLVMSLAQNHDIGFGLNPDWASLILLTPYALIGWFVGPFSGRLAPTIGYNNVLKLGLIGCIVGILVILFYGVHSLPILSIGVIALGVFYAGMANIILNGLGVVLSPADNQGFLPGMNAGAFNLGAGLSFALLPAVQMINGNTMTGYFNGILVGLVITILALFSSFLIPRPINAEVTH